MTEHDPGGSRRLPLLPGVRGSAEFGGPGDCYRYWLRRDWGDDGAPFLLSVGLNPSTAAADVDDPTVRLDVAMARRLGLTSLIKVNVCDYRVTHPTVLIIVDRPCSDENLRCIGRLAGEAQRIVVAWGRVAPSLERYVDLVPTVPTGRDLWCIGTNADGSPMHPLFKGVRPLVPYHPPPSHRWYP